MTVVHPFFDAESQRLSQCYPTRGVRVNPYAFPDAAMGLAMAPFLEAAAALGVVCGLSEAGYSTIIQHLVARGESRATSWENPDFRLLEARGYVRKRETEQGSVFFPTEQAFREARII